MIYYITTTGIGNAWVANELNILQKNKIPFVLYSMRRPDGVYHLSDWAQRINKKTKFLYPLPKISFFTSIVFAPFVFKKNFFSAFFNAFFSKKESLRKHIAVIFHFFVACYWAQELKNEEIGHIHSQWIHSCGTVGMYGAWLLGKSFSFTGHAVDLFRDSVALKDKIKRAEFIVCISKFHKKLYKSRGAESKKLHIAYCGIDTKLFDFKEKFFDNDKKLNIISSGRLVEKKGFEYLIKACKILKDKKIDFKCKIAGIGPLQKKLTNLVEKLGLEKQIKLTGKVLSQEKISSFMHKGDIYCLPCVAAKDGDIDGLPQMIMEAMACGVPVVSTKLVGIPDLVIHEKTGLLVDPENPSQIAAAIINIKNNPKKANTFSINGRKIIESQFDISFSLNNLIKIFKSKLY